MDAAVHLAQLLSTLDPLEVQRDAGLWNWLALYFIDELLTVEGARKKPRADAHYILDVRNYSRSYRHLLATPYRILQALPEHNRIFLNARLQVHGDLIEQVVSRLYLIRIPAVREAIDLLYYDTEGETIKRGVLSRNRRGTLYPRFVTRIQQLSLNYDLGSMDGGQLIQALGDEFDGWR